MAAAARFLVDLEAGPHAAGYRAWSFGSRGAAIDAALDAALGDAPADTQVVLASPGPDGERGTRLRERFGGDGPGRPRLRFFEGWRAEDFAGGLERLRSELEMVGGTAASGWLVCLESPCEPHGYLLDVPGICRAAHAAGATVLCDRSLGTPFLQPTLRREPPAERPDFVVHAAGLEPNGAGVATAGFVIAPAGAVSLPESPLAPTELAHLDDGMRILEMRLLRAGINTMVLARTLAAHRLIRVQSSAAPTDPNNQLAKRLAFLGLPAPLFTFDFEAPPGEPPWLEPAAFRRFVEHLEGSHSEDSRGITSELRPAPGITPTTLGVRVREDDPRGPLLRFLRAAEAALEPVRPGFMRMFPRLDAIDRLYERAYLAVHHRWIRSRRTMAVLTSRI